MGELEELSMRNRVLFFENELLTLHRTGKKFMGKTKENRANWEGLLHTRSRGNARGKRVYLTAKTIAMLSGMYDLDDIDCVRGDPIAQFDTTCKIHRID